MVFTDLGAQKYRIRLFMKGFKGNKTSSCYIYPVVIKIRPDASAKNTIAVEKTPKAASHFIFRVKLTLCNSAFAKYFEDS